MRIILFFTALVVIIAAFMLGRFSAIGFEREAAHVVAPEPTTKIDIEIGRVHSSQWFNFTIHSANVVSEYAGHTAAPGHLLWEVVITHTSTFFDPIPMGTFDWYMSDDSFRADIFAHIQFEGRYEMMPEEFILVRGQSETHTMLFEVPMDTTNLTLNFLEFNEFNEVGAMFVLPLQN